MTKGSLERPFAVELAPGMGMVVRRGRELLFVDVAAGDASDAHTALVDAFRIAPSGAGIDVVTAMAQQSGFDVPPFVVIESARLVRLAVFGDVELISDDPSMPRLSARGSGTWVERTLRSDGAIRIGVNDADIDHVTDLVAGTVRAGGFAMSVDPLRSTEDVTPDDAPVPVASSPRERWTPDVPFGSTAGSEADDSTPDDQDPVDPRDEEAARVATSLLGRPRADPVDDLLERRAASSDVTADYTGSLPGAGVVDTSVGAGWQLRFIDDDTVHTPELAPVEVVDVELVLGRSPVDPGLGGPVRLVALDCRELSKTHLHVRADEQGVWLTDLGSTNKTWIRTTGDGTLVPIDPHVPSQLDANAYVQIGSKVFVIERRSS